LFPLAFDHELLYSTSELVAVMVAMAKYSLIQTQIQIILHPPCQEVALHLKFLTEVTEEAKLLIRPLMLSSISTSHFPMKIPARKMPLHLPSTCSLECCDSCCI
jgi:hypothetical protein